MSAAVDSIVFPGESVNVISGGDSTIILGAGLQLQGESVVAVKAGLLRWQKTQSTFCVDVSQKRYTPVNEDFVLGVIIEKLAEQYKVDIGASAPAMLSAVAFDGATRRNKPNLQVGTLVYARVVVANRDMDTEVSCESKVGKKDWVTGESTFGEIKGGDVCKLSLTHAKRLLDGLSPVLELLGRSIPYELAIGANGRVWINAEAAKNTVAIGNAIMNSEYLNEAEVAAMVNSVLSSLS